MGSRFRVIALVLASAFCMTACGGSQSGVTVAGSESGSTYGAKSESLTTNGMGFDIGMSDYASSDSTYAPQSSNQNYQTSFNDKMEDITSLDTGVIDTEKLVYHADLTITTLDYAKAVKEFRKEVDNVDGFIENERDYTNDSGYRVYSDPEEWIHTYDATVRIPSEDFDDFLSEVEGIGDLADKSTYVENISQEYSTAQTSLQIYQTKYNRYLEMLKTANMSEMIEIERELTDIEIALAQYKTQLSKMDTDVAYSYVDVTIREVQKESEMGTGKGTFFERLGDAFEGSVRGFGRFLEWMLEFLIYAFPYLIILGVIVFILWKLHIIKIRKFKSKKKDVKDEQIIANPQKDVKDEKVVEAKAVEVKDEKVTETPAADDSKTDETK